MLESASGLLSDITDELKRAAEGSDMDPQALVELELRLAVVQRLKRKYGGSIASCLQYAGESEASLERIENFLAKSSR